MLNVILISIIIGLFNAGLYKSSEEGYILDGFSAWSERNLPWWLDTVLIGCVTCMGSFWSIAIVTFQYFAFGMVDIIWLPVIIPMSSFLGTFAYQQLK